jgi:hypothetical protein
MTVTLLIVHGLMAVALLGAITHQAVSMLRNARASSASGGQRSFLTSYSRTNARAFTMAVGVLYVAVAILGAVIYPAYRIDVRIPFEELGLPWAVGLFELKEHWSAVGLGVIPLYVLAWRAGDSPGSQRLRIALTLMLTLIVWNNFLVGHVLNNIRGLV